MSLIRVSLPYHLRNLARVDAEITVEVDHTVTQHAVLSAVEAKYPVLRGTIRDHVSLKRRAFLRVFGCGEDLSFESPDAELPSGIISGDEPFMIVGAIAGG